MFSVVTGVQTCALPICGGQEPIPVMSRRGLQHQQGPGAVVRQVERVHPHRIRRPFLAKRQCTAVDVFEITEQERQRRDREQRRSEEHTSELPSLMRISYAVFCLKKKKKQKTNTK